MAISPLTLAALATSAVPDLDVSAYRLLNPGHPHEVSAVIETTAGSLLVQLPISPQAEVHHSAKIMGQAALTEGVRAALPFTAPEVLGITRSADTRAIVSTFLQGDRFDAETLTPEAMLVDSLGASISAIHGLPFSVVTAQGLPNRSASMVRSEAARLVERAYGTGLMPELVKQYWSETLGDQSLWDFHPTVIHGSLSDDTVLITDDRVVAILDWAELSVGDPAADLAWLVGASEGTLETVVNRYASAHPVNTVVMLTRRAQFWHELGIARWLLHGVEQHEQATIDDAVELFDRLVARAARFLGNGAPQAQRLSAEELLEQTPQAARDLGQTDRYDALDDERVFESDQDFGERDPEETQPLDPLEDAQLPDDSPDSVR